MTTNEFKSHLDTTVIPVLSAPYTEVEDCKQDAPARALLLWSPEAGTYQFLRLDVDYTNHRHLRTLVNEIQQIADVCVLFYRVGGSWHEWRD